MVCCPPIRPSETSTSSRTTTRSRSVVPSEWSGGTTHALQHPAACRRLLLRGLTTARLVMVSASMDSIANVTYTRSGSPRWMQAASPRPEDQTRRRVVTPSLRARPGDQIRRFPDIPSQFPTVFDGLIRVMPGEPFKIHLKEDAVPFCVSSPRPVSLSLREPLRQELQELVSGGHHRLRHGAH